MSQLHPLTELRQLAGLTQLSLAAQSGVSNTTISRIEQRHVTPNQPTLRALAAVLGVTPAELKG